MDTRVQRFSPPSPHLRRHPLRGWRGTNYRFRSSTTDDPLARLYFLLLLRR